MYICRCICNPDKGGINQSYYSLPVQEIIHSLKLVLYLLIQEDTPWLHANDSLMLPVKLCMFSPGVDSNNTF